MGFPVFAATAALFQMLTAKVGGPHVTADSAHVVRSARSAQSSFEAFRRLRLPRSTSSHGGACDVRIGRYCYWRGDDEDDDPQPDEAPAIRDRRSELIHQLDSASRALPGDPWLAGQHVRYLVEANRIDEALAAARTCRAQAFWCAALEGYAAHYAGRYAVADSVYRVALAAMSDADRCKWLDIGELLSGDLADRYEKMDCAARQQLVTRIFWLGSPLLSVSTTDLFTEHLARITRARIAENSASIDGEPWADDVRSLMLRYGWPRWYSRSDPDFGSMRQPSFTGHDSAKPYDFIPSLRALEHIGLMGSDDWHLDDNRAQTGYSPSFARSMHEVPSQIAAFRRGDSTLIVAAWDVRQDTTLVGRDLDAALVLAHEGDIRGTERAAKSKAVGRISATGIVDSGIVSLELLSAENHRAGRKRVGLPARTPGSLALSDLLLYSASAGAVSELAVARDSALASTVLPVSRAIGVYWETYGLTKSDKPAQFELTIEPVGTSWMRRAAERLRLSDPTQSLRVAWQEVPGITDGIAPRGLRVDLSRLRSGRYRMRLSVQPDGGGAASAEREIEVP